MDATEMRHGGADIDQALAAFDVNGAVASGPIIFAALGSATRLEFTVIGEAANMAAKLEKHNKEEQARAITSLETYRQAVLQGFTPSHETELREGRTVLGVPEMLDIVVMCPKQPLQPVQGHSVEVSDQNG